MNAVTPVTLASGPDASEVTFDMGVDASGPFFAALADGDVIVATMPPAQARDLATRLMTFAAKVEAGAALFAMDRFR